MMEILIISPFAYALQRQVEKVKAQLFCDDIADYKLHTVQALPNEIDGKIYGHQYDYVYIDTEYISEEVGKIREHIRGQQYRQIARF